MDATGHAALSHVLHDATSSVVEQLRAQLQEKERKICELDRQLALARTVALPEDLDGWRAGGHPFVGREVVRAHGERDEEERRSVGVVVAWLPATVEDPFRNREGQPAELFRLRFKDGDLRGEVEDLEAHEVPLFFY